MGYPLAIFAQSGFYYPVFWIFPLLHILYTFHAAVIVQVFHVLFGSIGMFLLLNLIFKSSRYAFIGAVAFQFFGGFYSNAQHPDIIRAFAIAPWLFYVFKINIDKPSIKRRILFIPIVIYFLATGGYPGNFISSLFIITIFLCLEVFHAYLNVKRRALKVGAAMFGLMVIGISISVIHIGPIWQERNEIIRFTQLLSYTSLWIQDIPALFMSSSTIPGDVAMRSTFITLPMLIFASFISISEIKKHWIFLTILVISVLMVAGPYSPIWQTITSAVPGLKLSRFPSSDYRVFVAIPIIILGTAGIRSIIECGLSWKEFIMRAGFVVTWFSLGVYSLYSGTIFTVIHRQGYSPINTYPQLFINFQVTAAAFIFSATILFIIYYFRKNKFLDNVSGTKPIILSGLVVIVLLISLDGLRVINDMQTWKGPSSQYPFYFPIPLEKNGKLVTANIFQNIPQERPARETTATPVGGLVAWKGYLLGNYMMSDYGGEILNARSIVESNNIYRQYMLMKWTPLLIDPKNSNNNTDVFYIPQYYSNPLILDSKLPLMKIGNVATLKGKETIWSTPLKEKNVNYIEGTFRVVGFNKTDNHAGIVWNDGNNKQYYVFLRPHLIAIAGTNLKEIQSVDPIDRQNGKEYTLKVAYINNTIKVFLDDIPRIQIPNITGANAHISKVGIRSFNSIAQFEPIKVGTISTYQFQNNNGTGNVATLKGNETIWSTPLKEKNVNYIEDKLRVAALNKTDNHAGIVWNDGSKQYYVFLRPHQIAIAGTNLKEIESVDAIDRQNGKEYTLKIAYINNTIKVFLDDRPKIQIPNTAVNAHISKVGIQSFNSIAQFEPIKVGTISTYQFQNNNG
ncbi:MAG: hypothetical protein M3P08_16680, partial [Thermoproteota archaeon]|nr:hypothetical protein [Thermoproteota archaeon]